MTNKYFCKEGDPLCRGCAMVDKSDRRWMVATIAMIAIVMGAWMFFGWRNSVSAEHDILGENYGQEKDLKI